ncbi:ORF17 [Ostreid herpesvirus 1]|nr:ORF17 [Ostreid herpesvirus 1]
MSYEHAASTFIIFLILSPGGRKCVCFISRVVCSKSMFSTLLSKTLLRFFKSYICLLRSVISPEYFSFNSFKSSRAITISIVEFFCCLLGGIVSCYEVKAELCGIFILLNNDEENQ